MSAAIACTGIRNNAKSTYTRMNHGHDHGNCRSCSGCDARSVGIVRLRHGITVAFTQCRRDCSDWFHLVACMSSSIAPGLYLGPLGKLSQWHPIVVVVNGVTVSDYFDARRSSTTADRSFCRCRHTRSI